MRHLLIDLAAVAAVTVVLLVLCPEHPLGAMSAVVLTWVLLQLSCAYAFMAALFKGDIVEHRTEPRSYALAPRAVVNWRARRFLKSYLCVAKSSAPARKTPRQAGH